MIMIIMIIIVIPIQKSPYRRLWQAPTPFASGTEAGKARSVAHGKRVRSLRGGDGRRKGPLRLEVGVEHGQNSRVRAARSVLIISIRGNIVFKMPFESTNLAGAGQIVPY